VLVFGGAEGGMSQTFTAAPAWTLGGQPVWPAPIRLNHVSGPVLAIAGDADALWTSELSVDEISSELDVDRSPYPNQALIYLNAGHGVGTFPYQPIGSAALAGPRRDPGRRRRLPECELGTGARPARPAGRLIRPSPCRKRY
jgi:hypothetical protein